MAALPQSSPPTVEALLEALWAAMGTDLHLTAGAPPLIRVDGELRTLSEYEPLTSLDTADMVKTLLSPRLRERFAESTDIDFSFSWQGKSRIRGNAFRQQDTVAVALRSIPRYIPSFDQLGLPGAVRNFATLKQGLILVTGPTGAGKSTTLASMIDWINAHRNVHVITIEDPIEYVHYHNKAAVNQREVGTDTESFASALRAALREDPDVLLVGEMRDLDSIRFALTLAETGHLVLATLHTNDSTQAIDRLIDVFPNDQQPQIRVQLSASLTGVVYQRLVPRVGGGLVAAFEVLLATSAIRNLIKEGKTNQLRNSIVTGQRDGMQTLEASLSHLVVAGVISYDEAVSRSLYPKDVRQV